MQLIKANMFTAQNMRLEIFLQLVRSRIVGVLDVEVRGSIIELMTEDKIYAFVENPTLDSLCAAAVRLGTQAAGLWWPVVKTIIAGKPTGRVDGFLTTLANAGYIVTFMPDSAGPGQSAQAQRAEEGTCNSGRAGALSIGQSAAEYYLCQ
jgi:hypothetical protein